MEVIVLASTPHPTATLGSQTDLPANESDSPFAPLLNQAIAGKNSGKESKLETTSTENQASVAGQNQIVGQLLPQNAPLDPQLEETGIDIYLDTEPGSIANFTLADLLVNSSEMGDIFSAGINGIATGNGAQADGQSPLAQLVQLLTENTSSESPPSLTKVLTENPHLLQTNLATGQAASSGNTPQTQDLSLLLAQLQEIINANESKGIVVQQANGAISLDELTNLTVQAGQMAATRTTETAAVSALNVGMSTLNPAAPGTGQSFSTADSQLDASSLKGPSLRQDQAQQYLDGKISLKEDQQQKDGNSQPNQQSQQNNSSGDSQSSLQSTNGLSLGQADQTGDPALFSLSAQKTSGTQHTSPQTGTLTLPSGTMVAEQEILNQVLQRFQLTSRLQSSRINLKLHPVELGELKIDITLKGGSIKANVVAQSQHVQEILEKNMPKLRAVLEQQGFAIEEITVSAKSETVANFDLFGDQLPNRQAFSSPDSEKYPSTTFGSTLDNSMTQAIKPESGLSIRA